MILRELKIFSEKIKYKNKTDKDFKSMDKKLKDENKEMINRINKEKNEEIQKIYKNIKFTTKKPKFNL